MNTYIPVIMHWIQIRIFATDLFTTAGQQQSPNMTIAGVSEVVHDDLMPEDVFKHPRGFPKVSVCIFRNLHTFKDMASSALA